MELGLKLYVREHRNGFFTARVIGTSLEVYASSLDAARQDLLLLIGDRIERTHPSRQASVLPISVERQETITVEGLLPIAAATMDELGDLSFSALLGESRAFLSVWVPRLDLHLWLPKKGAASAKWEAAVRDLVERVLASRSVTERLGLRWERREWIESLMIEADPPPLSAFTGKHRGLLELPIEVSAPERGEEEKKRPETPTLARIGSPLSKLAEAQELERAEGRSAELEALYRLVAGPGDKAIVVVGPSGVGKSTLLSELVHRLRAEGSPKELRERPVYFADASRLIAGEGWFGDWQRQCLDVVAECIASEVIWMVGPLLPLLDAGKSIHSEQNVAQLLKPYLAGKRLTIIGECTDQELAKLELRDASFARTFIPFRLEEPSAEAGREILERVAEALTATDGVRLSSEALTAIRELSRRYVSEGSHLGAAIHFLRRTVERAAAGGATVLKRADVVRAFAAETGLPERLIRDDLPLDAAEVERAFRARLVGQDEAVARMVDLVAVIKAGLSDLGRPLGSFLFLGPTGVGKTETAKALATYLFGGAHRLVRFDMSEYVGWDAVHRFLGDAHTEGKLVEAIRRQPFSVVLLDEIEKASPAIFDVLLQVLGEARLTDEAGRTADFKNAVIVMTSNLGVDSQKTPVGIGPAPSGAQAEHFRREAERFFRPELFNRIDHLVPFHPLEAPAIAEITARELDKLSRREGLRQRRMSLSLGEGVAAWLADRGVDPRYGARPLKRVLERSLTVPLARRLSATGGSGGVIEVEVRDQALCLSTRPASASAGADGAELLRQLEVIDRLSFRVQRWMSSEEMHSLAEELRLLDQLTQHKAFWEKRELAEARLVGLERKRAVREAWLRVEAELEALEDLAYEAYWARDPGPAPAIAEEIGRLKIAIDPLELRLYALRFADPDRAVLYFLPSRGSQDLAGQLLRVYARIAHQEGWALSVHAAVRLDPQPEPPKKRKKHPAAAEPESALALGNAPPRAARASRDERVHWREEAKLVVDPGREEDEVAHDLASHVLRSTLESEMALVFEGPNARAVLSFEGGAHDRVSGTTVDQVRIAVADLGEQLTHPADLVGGQRARTIQENKHILDDHRLELRLGLEPKLHRLYRRLMRAGMYRTALGPELDWPRAFEVG